MQVAASAAEIAKRIAANEPIPSTSKGKPENWEETRNILYKRADIKPPQKHKRSDLEHTLDKLDFKDMAEKEYIDNLGKVAKAGASASAMAVRMIKDLRDTVHLLGHSVRGLQDQVSIYF